MSWKANQLDKNLPLVSTTQTSLLEIVQRALGPDYHPSLDNIKGRYRFGPRWFDAEIYSLDPSAPLNEILTDNNESILTNDNEPLLWD